MAPYIVHEIPYLDTRDINLDWLFKIQKHLQEEINKILNALPEDCIIMPEKYGAVGDGIADDTDAIQQCIDENPLATIVFRDGNYKITNTLHFYNQWGGQQIILGGARIVWGGGFLGDRPMITLDRETDHDSMLYGSACRILGGTLDGMHRIGYGVESHAFYTTIDSLKITGFTNTGLVVGKIIEDESLPNLGRISQGAHYNNLQIYQYDGEMSFENTIGMTVKDPDSVYTQVITNRTMIGIQLETGGGEFSNCHTTIQYPAGREADVTDAVFQRTANIYIKPRTLGATQLNTFHGCYFNMGKYVVKCETNSRFVTILDSCFYMWLTTDPYTSITDKYCVLCGGKPSDFKCNNFDLIFTPGINGFSFVDYFPTSQPPIVPLPDMIKINSNDRHPEASIIQAWNMQPENTLTPLCSSSNPAELNTYYEVGAILLCYNGISTSSGNTSPVKVRAYEGAGVAEWLIGFESDNDPDLPRVHPVILDWHCTTDFNTLLFYIEPDPEDISIEGIVYPTYKIYMQRTAYGGLPTFLTIENDSPFMKCYVRAQANAARVRADGTGLTALPNTIKPSDMNLWYKGTATNSVKNRPSSNAGGTNAVALGGDTTATGGNALASGRNTQAVGTSSVAFGTNCRSNRLAQFSFGEFNSYETGDATARGNYIEIVGNGTASDARSNARTLDWSGNEWIAGALRTETGRVNDYIGIEVAANESIEIQINGNFALLIASTGDFDVEMYICNYASAAFTMIHDNNNRVQFSKSANSKAITITNTYSSVAYVVIIGNCK